MQKDASEREENISLNAASVRLLALTLATKINVTNLRVKMDLLLALMVQAKMTMMVAVTIIIGDANGRDSDSSEVKDNNDANDEYNDNAELLC